MTDQLPELVRDLMQPEAYPFPHPSSVELRVTHSSWVFVTDNEVWKVKRPVNLGFLDFRELSARHHDCEAEVELNRRLAPDVYLGVFPILHNGQRHVIGSRDIGPAVEWVVRMRRLSDDVSAEQLLRAGCLDAHRLRALAVDLASFFRNARPAPEFATLAALSATVEENCADAQRFVGDLIEQQTLDQVRDHARHFLHSRAAVFASRVGRAVDGHGDLRLEHVFFEKDRTGSERPVVIDCIEFNNRFRCGDPAGDVAFLAMELEAAHRPDLAGGFIARFAEAAHDFDLYGVLDFYLSYRAWVRGKVAALVAADGDLPPALRQSKREEAVSHFALARAEEGRALDRPFIIAMTGLPGSGKSALAQALGDVLAVPVISSDRVRKALVNLSPTERGSASLYAADRTVETYGEMLRGAEVVVGSRRGVILDATFARREFRAGAAAIASRQEATFVLVESVCSDEATLRARLRAREQGPNESDARERELELVRSGFEPVLSTETPAHHIVVETTEDSESCIVRSMTALRSAGIVPASERRRG